MGFCGVKICVCYWFCLHIYGYCYGCRTRLATHVVYTAACTGVPYVRSTGRWRDGSLMWLCRWLSWTHLQFNRWDPQMTRKIQKQLLLTEAMSIQLWKCSQFRTYHLLIVFKNSMLVWNFTFIEFELLLWTCWLHAQKSSESQYDLIYVNELLIQNCQIFNC